MTMFVARFRPTVRARLTLLYGSLFLVAGVVLLALTYVLVKNNLQYEALPGAQLTGVKAVESAGAGGQNAGERPTEGPVDKQGVAGQGVAGRAVAGRAVAGQPAGPVLIDKEYIARLYQAPSTTAITVGEMKDVMVQAKDGYERETLNSLLTQGSIALGVVAAAALGLGWLLADRALRPVHQITETASRVARSHDLTERIAYAGPRDDVKELADTFDTMLGRLARAFDGQQRFVANASHELRTPLAINRTLVDVAVRRPDATEDVKRLGESLLIVNGRHERLIDGLLTLAGSENTVVDAVPLDLADVAGHVLSLAAAEATAHGVRTGRELGSAPIAGDPVLIERLVQNLVENAIRHNHEDGELEVTTRSLDGRAELTVTNTGPVVPPYEIETIFEPFRRLGTDRVHSDRGCGLGLSIVRATAAAHGGTVAAEPRPGGGLTVTARLPTPP